MEMNRAIASLLIISITFICTSCAVKSIGPKRVIAYESWQKLIATDNYLALGSEHNVYICKQDAKWNVPKADPNQFTCLTGGYYHLEYMGYCNGMFIVVYGDCLFTSQDGSKWQYVGMKPASIVSIMYFNNSYYILCEDGLLLVSPRLGDNVYSKIKDDEINKVNGAFIRNNTICAWSVDKIYEYSVDDKKWSLLCDMRDKDTKISQILRVGRKYFIPSRNKLMVSENLIDWRHAADLNIWDIAEGNGTYIAIGYKQENSNEHFAFRSSDGYDWKPVDIPVLKGDGFLKIAYSRNSFVAAGTHRIIAESADGITWAIRHSESKKYRRDVEMETIFDSLFEGFWKM